MPGLGPMIGPGDSVSRHSRANYLRAVCPCPAPAAAGLVRVPGACVARVRVRVRGACVRARRARRVPVGPRLVRASRVRSICHANGSFGPPPGMRVSRDTPYFA